MRKWLIIFIFFLIAFSCRKGDKNHIIPRRDFTALLIDIHIADAMALNPSINEEFGGLDSTLLYQAVLEKYGYSKEEFKNTLEYFSSKPEKLIAIYDDVFSELSKRSEEAKENYNSTTLSRTYLVWQPIKSLFGSHGDSAIYPPEFYIDIDTTGTFVLSVNIKILPEDKSVNPRILAYFFNPRNDREEDKIYFEQVPLLKVDNMREYTLLKECTDTSLTKLHIIIPMHDTPDSVFRKEFDMQNLRISLLNKEKN